jgi:hypothetical protein
MAPANWDGSDCLRLPAAAMLTVVLVSAAPQRGTAFPKGLLRCFGLLGRSPLHDHLLGDDGWILTSHPGQKSRMAVATSMVFAENPVRRLAVPQCPVELRNVFAA